MHIAPNLVHGQIRAHKLVGILTYALLETHQPNPCLGLTLYLYGFRSLGVGEHSSEWENTKSKHNCTRPQCLGGPEVQAG